MIRSPLYHSPTPQLEIHPRDAAQVGGEEGKPLVVRYKLDTCGVKLKLPHWHRFTLAQRRNL